MSAFLQLPSANASSVRPIAARPCCTQRCFQHRAGSGSGLLFKPFQTPKQLLVSQSIHRSGRKPAVTTCQAVAAPPRPASQPQTGPGGQAATLTDHPIENKHEQKGPKILIAGAGIGGLVLAVGLLKRGFDVKVFEKNITAIRGEGKYRGPIQVSKCCNIRSLRDQTVLALPDLTSKHCICRFKVTHLQHLRLLTKIWQTRFWHRVALLEIVSMV